MPSQAIIPLAKNVVKYGMIMGGGKLLYDHSISQWSIVADQLGKLPDSVKTAPAQLAIGVVALGIAHLVLSKTAQHRHSKAHFIEEAREKGQAPPEEKPDAAPPPAEGEAPAAPAPAPGGNVVMGIVGWIISIIPKTACAVAGGQLVIANFPGLEGLYGLIGAKILSVPAMAKIFQAGEGAAQAASAHTASSAAGLVLILLGYAIVRRGVVKAHGPVHRRIYVNDRRVESLHWDTQKIRGFGMQLQTMDTEGIIGDLTPTADTEVSVYDHEGRHKQRPSTIMYLKNLEPAEKPLEKLAGNHVTAVREAISEIVPGEAVTAKDLEQIDLQKLKAVTNQKLGEDISDVNLGRVLLALMEIGPEDVLKADEGRVLDRVNDVEKGSEGGIFHRVLYRKDDGGHYVPIATMAEDLTLTDRISSSERNGFGPNYWRHGKVLMGFWVSRGAGDNSNMIRMPVHQIQKSRLRRYWDWGQSYRWTFLQHNLRIDEEWFSSYGWLIPIPGRALRRYYKVRDSRGEVVATMKECVWPKLTLDFNWRVEIYCDRLNNEEAGNTLALFTEFLHNRYKYFKSRIAPGNTAHERLLVGGGKKRGDATEAIGGGL